MKISEKQLTNIIMESVKSGLVEQKLKKAIKQMVRESLESFGGMSQFEAEDSENEPKELTKSDSGKADFNHENRDEEERRAQVEKFFSKDGVDIAPYAYKLYHVEAREGEDTNDMKNARSKFMKCLNHEPNEAGYPYSFSSSETNKLQSMISSNQLNEGRVKINEAQLKNLVAESIKKILKETELDYDVDNFSGRWNRGPRYNIYIGDTLMYSDIPEETADRVWDEVCRKAEMWGEEPRCEEI